MPQTRTGEGRLPRPPRELARSTAVLIAALAACASLLLACGPDDENENQIAPIRATLTIDPVSSDPAVFFRAATDSDPGDDLVFIEVVLRDATSPQFDAFNLEIHYNPVFLQFADLRDILLEISTPFGPCDTSNSSCMPVSESPICLDNGRDANATGELLIGVASLTGCPGATVPPVPGEITLLTLGFVAATTIAPGEDCSIATPMNPGNGCIVLTANSPTATGECEILSVVGGVPTDLGIPCFGGNATVSATR